ncbi:hypothetical protein J2X72_002859 [Phyllobacterium sp. 1468]|uniref:hypothetical protein n=1 Tax=Phyllobacterium sp. 1468 TaxID=2817759 RepID=UPI00285936D7|nr:hypothetical protein [Phyllobacterium sp. 1468]MDR6634059.1 hypothetical protein [Phyllobacterium sp. 1468]
MSIFDTPEYTILRLKHQIAGNNVIFALERLAPHYGSNYRAPDHVRREQKMLLEQLDLLETLELRANFDPDQSRVPAGSGETSGRWSDENGGSSQVAYLDNRGPLNRFESLTAGGGGGGFAAGAGVGAATGLAAPELFKKPEEFPSPLSFEDGLATFNRLSKQNNPRQQPIILFRPKDWGGGDESKPISMQLKSGVRLATRDEIKRYCPEFDQVQRLADEAAARTGPRSEYSSAATWGTATHVNMKDLTLEDPDNKNLYTEESFVKYREEVMEAPDFYQRNPQYPSKNSLRIDTRGQVQHDDTVCVYDLKTGTKGITIPRAIEIYESVKRRIKPMPEVRIVEVNPSR